MNLASSLRDKVAIVTGGGGNIGSATAMLLASRGAKVVVADRDIEAARRITAGLTARGYAAEAIAFDLASESTIRALMEATLSGFGSLHILHNNAAAQSFVDDQDIESMDVAVWDRVFAGNARGTMLCCKYALKVMPRHAGASIINTASNLALQGHLFQAAYSASKAAILQMTRSIASSHGRHGIRCNAVSPGLLNNPQSASAIPTAVRKSVEAETLTGHLGDVSDIAAMVAFLASDEARHITGQNMVVDGGNSCHVPGFEQLLATLPD